MKENESNLRQQITDLSKTLKLPSIRKTLQDTTQEAVCHSWSYEQFLFTLLQNEDAHREENRKKAHVKRAGFPQYKYLQELNREELPDDVRIVLPELETLEFIKNAQNIVLAGNPGTGKTHIAIGLGINACKMGYNVLFTSIPQLLTQIRECRSARTLHQLELKFIKYDLVICDEFGYVSFNKDGAEALFNHLSLRTGRKATIITTNLAFDRGKEIFGDPILTAAMVDRLTHKAYLINMNGDSFRMKETQKWIKNKRI